MCDYRSSAKSTSCTCHLYMSNHVMINYFYTAYHGPMLATKCKDEKWTGLPSLSSSNHKHRAGVKKYSGHSDSFERVTVSTLFLYTCLVLVIRETPREQPRPLSIFTLLYFSCSEGPPRSETTKHGRDCSCGASRITNSRQV